MQQPHVNTVKTVIRETLLMRFKANTEGTRLDSLLLGLLCTVEILKQAVTSVSVFYLGVVKCTLWGNKEFSDNKELYSSCVTPR